MRRKKCYIWCILRKKTQAFKLQNSTNRLWPIFSPQIWLVDWKGQLSVRFSPPLPDRRRDRLTPRQLDPLSFQLQDLRCQARPLPHFLQWPPVDQPLLLPPDQLTPQRPGRRMPQQRDRRMPPHQGQTSAQGMLSYDQGHSGIRLRTKKYSLNNLFFARELRKRI